LVFGFLIAGAGFIRGILDGSRPPAKSLASRARLRSSASRTALVMVIRHEDVSRVQAGVRAMYRSLAASGSLDPFAIFILSDSTDVGVAAAEEQAVQALTCELDAVGRLVYRRRSENSDRKFVWLVPTLAGLALSIPLSIGSSRAASGRLARRCGLFLIPEEVSAPPLLRAFRGEDGWDHGRARPSLDRLGTATHASA
jgi:membrane glycosyltransferase